MLKKTLIPYLVQFMTALVPTKEHTSELESDVLDRYRDHAAVIVDVAFEPEEKPLFKGEDGRALTAILMLSIDRYESSFRKGTIHGDCRNNPDGYCRKPADKPNSYCFMQVQPGPTGIVLDGDSWRYGLPEEASSAINGNMLDGDDRLCARVALHMMRASMKATGDLGIYTGEGKGGKKAGHRMNTAKAWTRKHPLPVEEAINE